jgi:hypothetical protein
VTFAELLTRKATLLRLVPADDELDGDPVYSEVATDVLCELQQSGQSEAADGAIQSARFRVFLPGDSPLSGWDAIELDGERYAVEGDASALWNPRERRFHHVEAEVVRTR